MPEEVEGAVRSEASESAQGSDSVPVTSHPIAGRAGSMPDPEENDQTSEAKGHEPGETVSSKDLEVLVVRVLCEQPAAVRSLPGELHPTRTLTGDRPLQELTQSRIPFVLAI